MRKLRLGVIGAGSWTVTSHLPNLRARSADVEFVAVCRKGVRHLEKVKRDWGFRVASESHLDVLDTSPDIVLVASPAALHFEHARDALLAGAHVLVEKPFTIDPSHAWELVALSEKVNRHLLVAYGFNYLPLVRRARAALLDHGGVGVMESLSVSMASLTRELLSGAGFYPKADASTLPEAETWIDPALSGGGYAQAQLTHALGLALWLFETSARRAYSLFSSPLGGAVEQHAVAAVQWDGGAIGTVRGNSAHLGSTADVVRVHAVGQEGQFRLELDRDHYLYQRGDKMLGYEGELGSGAYNCDGPPHALVDLALGNDVANESPGWLAARTVDAIAAMYRSARSGLPEDLAPAIR